MVHKQPLFSIIIPTYARPRELATCLRCLAGLDYPHDRFEVIVVDDGSDTPPEALAASFSGPLDITLLTQRHAGPAAARNAGAVRARGRFLAFTDDDCQPSSDWLHALAARVAVAPDHAIGGRTLNALPDNLYSTASHILVNYLYTYYNANAKQPRFLTSNNLTLPADRFHALGGFDTTYTLSAAEDREFCDRWLHQGYRMTYAPEVLVYHAHTLTFRTFWRQHLNYGRGAFRFHEGRARRGQGHVRLEPMSFYQGLVSHAFSLAGGRRAPLLATLVVASQVGNAAGFAWESITRVVTRPDSR